VTIGGEMRSLHRTTLAQRGPEAAADRVFRAGVITSAFSRQRLEATGQRESYWQDGHRRSRIAHLEPQIRRWIEATPDMTLAELSERLAGKGIQIKVPALWHQLDKCGLSFKKTPARQRAGTRRRTAGTRGVET